MVDESYTDGQFEAALTETIKRMLVKGVLAPADSPTAYLLGGQNGAGKSTLHRVLGSQCNRNVIVINGDEYRKSHPRFAEIQECYGVDAP